MKENFFIFCPYPSFFCGLSGIFVYNYNVKSSENYGVIMTLKKSTDRMIYLIGMALAFIGMLIPCVREPEEGVLNVFSGAAFFNQPGIAYISTFMVIVWLAALAGIIVYFLTNFMVGDFVAWLVGAGFGAAHAIAMCMYLVENYEELGMLSWLYVGSFVTCAGFTTALVGLILQAIHIQHPLKPKAE